MEIHKPKAAHSWREFLIEIGTIICGILIALGLEQAVEAGRTSAEVREAREALREEVKDNVSALAFGVEEDKCLLPKFEAFGAWAKGGSKPPELTTILAEYGSSTWDTVKMSAVPHMPLGERRALAAFYDMLANQNKVVDIQRASSLVLTGALERRTLDPEDTRRVLDAVATERKLTNFHMYNAATLLRGAEAFGIKAPPLTSAQLVRIEAICGHPAVLPPIGGK
jgi:hypothetical protein